MTTEGCGYLCAVYPVFFLGIGTQTEHASTCLKVCSDTGSCLGLKGHLQGHRNLNE